MPRRQEQAEVRKEMEYDFRHGPLDAPRFAGQASRETLGSAAENINRAQENGGGWNFGNGRMDMLRHQASAGKS